MPIPKTTYYIKIRFIEPILGSLPAKENLLESYIKTKLIKEIEKLEKALERTTSEEKRLALQEKLNSLLQEQEATTYLPDVANMLTVFPRDPQGNLCILNYHVLGYFKEMAGSFLKEGFRQKFSRYTDVKASLNGRYRECLLMRNGQPITQADAVLERSLRAWVRNQYIVSIVASEYLAPPIETEFFLIVLGDTKLHNITEDIIKYLLEIGEEKGIGQWRNAGYGKFKVVEFKKVELSSKMKQRHSGA